MTTEYEQRRQRARQRLADALRPATGAERGACNYIADVAPSQLGSLIGMMERVVKAARAEGYDRGWHEGVEYAKGARAVNREAWSKPQHCVGCGNETPMMVDERGNLTCPICGHVPDDTDQA